MGVGPPNRTGTNYKYHLEYHSARFVISESKNVANIVKSHYHTLIKTLY